MNWLKLESQGQIQTIKEKSEKNHVLIFKHSTRCSISHAALDRLERSWKAGEMENVDVYQLDLLKHQSVSNMIATEFSVAHESPQILLIKNRRSVYDNSHFGIAYQDLKAAIGAGVD